MYPYVYAWRLPVAISSHDNHENIYAIVRDTPFFFAGHHEYARGRAEVNGIAVIRLRLLTIVSLVLHRYGSFSIRDRHFTCTSNSSFPASALLSMRRDHAAVPNV